MQANIANPDLSRRFVSADLSKKFEAIALRNRLVADWAAELLGRDDKAAYAAELNDIDIAAAGGNDMFFRLRSDFSARGIHMREGDIHKTIDRFFTEAVEAVL